MPNNGTAPCSLTNLAYKCFISINKNIKNQDNICDNNKENNNNNEDFTTLPIPDLGSEPIWHQFFGMLQRCLNSFSWKKDK